MKTFRKITDQELGTVLAALRIAADNPGLLPLKMPELFTDHAVLEAEEIDALCERINTGVVYVEKYEEDEEHG